MPGVKSLNIGFGVLQINTVIAMPLQCHCTMHYNIIYPLRVIPFQSAAPWCCLQVGLPADTEHTTHRGPGAQSFLSFLGQGVFRFREDWMFLCWHPINIDKKWSDETTNVNPIILHRAVLTWLIRFLDWTWLVWWLRLAPAASCTSSSLQ